jgi:hypothetical protein
VNPPSSSRRGNPHHAPPNTPKFTKALQKNAHRHESFEIKTPLKTIPVANPTGCPAPRIAKLKFRVGPRAKERERMPTAEGRQAAMEIPCKARKMINWRGVWERPEARVKIA